MNTGQSALVQYKPPAGSGYYTASGGGNSGCVLSPTPRLGWSAYQDPNTPVIPVKKVVSHGV